VAQRIPSTNYYDHISPVGKTTNAAA
jgi:hypothetical protein